MRTTILKNSIHSPLVSIITVTYNAEDTLRNCIESVINQTYRNFELIIVDGASSDSTCSILRSYGHEITFLVSEPDDGVYDAMNKGLNAASGKWLYFLGADDRLFNNRVLEDFFTSDVYKYDILIGKIIGLNSHSIHVPSFSWKLYIKNTVSHQSAFYNKRLFDGFSYNKHFKISGDYELNLKCYRFDARVFYNDLFICSIGEDGLSKQSMYVGYLEEMLIRKKYFPKPIYFLLNMQTFIRFTLKRIYILFKFNFY
jgi:putative colanic acid biosynthesis glycosyltransferase